MSVPIRFHRGLLRSPDTDVVVLAIYVCNQLRISLFFRVLSKKVYRYIDVQSIVAVLGHTVCKAFSGCDSTSRQFAGHGKKKSMKLLQQSNDFCTSTGLLRQDLTPSSAICALYLHPKIREVNMVRNTKWNRPTKDITQLPPCHDSALLHIRRTNYQSAI